MHGLKTKEVIAIRKLVTEMTRSVVDLNMVVQKLSIIYGRYAPNSEKITKESVQANRNRWQREIRIEWAKCDMDMRFALVNSMPPSAYVAHEKVSLALWYRGRLSKADFDFTAGLTGAELESLEQHFDHCEGWYESVNVNDMYEDSYSRILIKRSNGSKGGRPKVNNL